ncbi:MAG: DUF3240 family protein [Idiomarina sp.]|nr:DUF3240 family protein [Idiomarina sp.]
MKSKLLKLYFSREQKAEVVDCLLQVDSLSGFSLYDIEGFSRRHESFDLAEQIRGARRMLTAEIICSDAEVKLVQSELKKLHFKEPVRYNVLELDDCGHV